MNAIVISGYNSRVMELAEKLATEQLKDELGADYSSEFVTDPNGDIRYTEFAQDIFIEYYSNNLDLINKTLLG